MVLLIGIIYLYAYYNKPNTVKEIIKYNIESFSENDSHTRFDITSIVPFYEEANKYYALIPQIKILVDFNDSAESKQNSGLNISSQSYAERAECEYLKIQNYIDNANLDLDIEHLNSRIHTAMDNIKNDVNSQVQTATNNYNNARANC
jgi:hypothetical protein